MEATIKVLGGNFTMIWASRRQLQERVASVPDPWLTAFMVKYPNDIRKFGPQKQSALLFRVSKVLECIENKEYFNEPKDDKDKKKDKEASDAQ